MVTIEDPLDEDDFEGFAELTQASGIQIVGDDLFVTDPEAAADGPRRGRGQLAAVEGQPDRHALRGPGRGDLAHRGGYTVVVSERSGETEDPIIADLAVALGAGQIKTGAPVRGERTAKYNRLIRIEEELGAHRLLPRRHLPGGDRRVIRTRPSSPPPECRSCALWRCGWPGPGPRPATSARRPSRASSPPTPGSLWRAASTRSGPRPSRRHRLRQGYLPIAAALERDPRRPPRRRHARRSPRRRHDRARADRGARRRPPAPERASTAAADGSRSQTRLGAATWSSQRSPAAAPPSTSLPPSGRAEEKRLLHELLLASGAPIFEINAVRKHVSRDQGRAAGRADRPARLVNLTVSDVAGDVLDLITDPPSRTPRRRRRPRRPSGARSLGSDPREHPPAPGTDGAHSPRLETEPHTVVLVNGAGACDAMVAEAARRRHRPTSSRPSSRARPRSSAPPRGPRARRAPAPGPDAARVLVGCGGEATVTLRANGASALFGGGGPNQEAAVAAALALDGAPSPPASSTPTAPTAAPRPPAGSSTATAARGRATPGSTSRPRSPATGRATHSPGWATRS